MSLPLAAFSLLLLGSGSKEEWRGSVSWSGPIGQARGGHCAEIAHVGLAGVEDRFEQQGELVQGDVDHLA